MERLHVYKCEKCGNVVEVLHVGGGELICCSEAMAQLVAKGAEDEGKEKHVPVVEKKDTGCVIKVGSVPHPMEEKHHIEWIELILKNGEAKTFLDPGQVAEMVCDCDCDIVEIREYCNLHGLWKK